MFEISETALNVLADYLGEQQVNAALRITPMAGNCAGPHLRIQVCDPQPDDYVFDRSGLRFVVNKKLLRECGCIRIDYEESCVACCCSGSCAGFHISGESKYPFAGRCVTEPTRCDLRCSICPSVSTAVSMNNRLDFLL